MYQSEGNQINWCECGWWIARDLSDKIKHVCSHISSWRRLISAWIDWVRSLHVIASTIWIIARFRHLLDEKVRCVHSPLSHAIQTELLNHLFGKSTFIIVIVIDIFAARHTQKKTSHRNGVAPFYYIVIVTVYGKAQKTNHIEINTSETKINVWRYID